MAWGAETGLKMLLRLDSQADGFYPYQVARADLLRRTNQSEVAADAYGRALALCGNPAERAYLERRQREMLNMASQQRSER
jgi:RNA polymerase sigma-70 factor, ECF subfamily